ncbi:MAG: GDSL-type esterase/lipase family protein [Sphingobacteriaceae bacterium]
MKPLSYLALGDSYTIGEAVTQAESFPYQLQQALSAKGIAVAEPIVIAQTGWTTDELIAAIQERKLKQTFDLVTLLIGVNNQYRGYALATYEKEFSELLQTAIAYAGGDPNKVRVISIPDWGVSPFAEKEGRDAAQVAEEIDAYNALNKLISMAARVSYIDITLHSRLASTDLSLLAADGLHPSGKMYAE